MPSDGSITLRESEPLCCITLYTTRATAGSCVPWGESPRAIRAYEDEGIARTVARLLGVDPILHRVALAIIGQQIADDRIAAIQAQIVIVAVR